jgi:hypothetical protein
MREFKWTWKELEETPFYVQMYCWDFLQLVFQHENEEADKAKRNAKRGR